MLNLRDKISIFVGGQAHAIADDINDGNIDSYKEQIRRLTEARENFQSSISAEQFNLQTAEADLAADDTHAEQMKDDIRALMGANGGNPSDGQKAEAEKLVTGLRALLDGRAAHAEAVEKQRGVVQQMQDGIAATVQKEAQYKSKIAALQTAAASAKSMEGVAKQVNAITDLTSGLDGADSIGKSIDKRAFVATDAMNRALGTMGKPLSDRSERDKMKDDDLMASILGKAPAQSAA